MYGNEFPKERRDVAMEDLLYSERITALPVPGGNGFIEFAAPHSLCFACGNRQVEMLRAVAGGKATKKNDGKRVLQNNNNAGVLIYYQALAG